MRSPDSGPSPDAPLASTPGSIRVARRADRDAVLALWLDLVAYHRQLDPDYPLPSGLRASLQRELERVLRSPHCSVWVAQEDGELAGFLLAELEARRPSIPSGVRSCWIHELFVSPEWRRRGIGRALVQHAEQFFESRGAGRPAVRVVSGNRAALRFWERAGFSEKARILERDR